MTTHALPIKEDWRAYRARADCENRIKELKASFALDAFKMRDFRAVEATLSFAMPADNPMGLFHSAVLRARTQPTRYTLRGLVLPIGGS